jgi:hypothetical protein
MTRGAVAAIRTRLAPVAAAGRSAGAHPRVGATIVPRVRAAPYGAYVRECQRLVTRHVGPRCWVSGTPRLSLFAAYSTPA